MRTRFRLIKGCDTTRRDHALSFAPGFIDFGWEQAIPTYVSPRAQILRSPSSELRNATNANKLASLEGVNVGLFNNSKPNAALLLEEVATAIGTRIRLGDLIRASKPLPGEPASDSVYDTLAERCGAVIFAAAD